MARLYKVSKKIPDDEDDEGGILARLRFKAGVKKDRKVKSVTKKTTKEPSQKEYAKKVLALLRAREARAEPVLSEEQQRVKEILKERSREGPLFQRLAKKEKEAEEAKSKELEQEAREYGRVGREMATVKELKKVSDILATLPADLGARIGALIPALVPIAPPIAPIAVPKAPSRPPTPPPRPISPLIPAPPKPYVKPSVVDFAAKNYLDDTDKESTEVYNKLSDILESNTKVKDSEGAIKLAMRMRAEEIAPLGLSSNQKKKFISDYVKNGLPLTFRKDKVLGLLQRTTGRDFNSDVPIASGSGLSKIKKARGRPRKYPVA